MGRPPIDEELLAAMGRPTPSELLPTLLEHVRRQAERRKPAELLRQYERDAFVRPSAIDLRATLEFDRVALSLASAFEALLLAPLAPLGVCSVVSPTHQDRAVSTIRSSEVVSDPTNVLALECARRLLGDRRAHVRLCTIQQVTRAQRFSTRPGFSQHFRLFALAEAGSATPEHGFEVAAIVDHVALFDRIMDGFEAMGCRFTARRVGLHASDSAKICAVRVRERLAATLPKVEIHELPLESNYYDGVRVLFGADDLEGNHVPFCDTGLFDWLGALTSNRRMRLICSGMGIQLVPLLFKPSSPG
ncbi:hypothetical protein ACNOYE_20565 [Nannocystaceae bacterium ST9]